jgi:hypothetical protein
MVDWRRCGFGGKEDWWCEDLGKGKGKSFLALTASAQITQGTEPGFGTKIDVGQSTEQEEIRREERTGKRRKKKKRGKETRKIRRWKKTNSHSFFIHQQLITTIQY